MRFLLETTAFLKNLVEDRVMDPAAFYTVYSY
jgi:hypothetical protein